MQESVKVNELSSNVGTAYTVYVYILSGRTMNKLKWKSDPYVRIRASRSSFKKFMKFSFEYNQL